METERAGGALLEEILTLAGAMVAEGPLLEPLCRAAAAELERRLRPGVAAEDCGSAFPCAAACLAAADAAESGRSGAMAAFRAGEVSVTERPAAETARSAAALRRTAERLMAPYVDGGSFRFQGVGG